MEVEENGGSLRGFIGELMEVKANGGSLMLERVLMVNGCLRREV